MKNLNSASIGDIVKVNKIVGERNITRRIMEMGLVKGVEILIKNFAPLGDPIEIQFRGCCVSIKRCFAKNIIIC